MPAERIQIVNAHDRPIGATTREEAWRGGLTHRMVRILIRDGSGRVLLQQRSQAKKSYPGRWTDAATGHVDEGEAPDMSATRELEEELSVLVMLKQLGRFHLVDETPKGKIDAFHYIYSGILDARVELHPDPEEVGAVHWFSPSELTNEIAINPEIFTPGLIEVWRRFGKIVTEG